MYRTVKTLLVILACNFLVAEACLCWYVKKSPPSHHHRPPAHHPPPRPPPPPPVRPTKISTCPPSQNLTSNRGETTRNIFWNAPQITDGSPPYNVVRTGKASGSEFECNGQPSEVCYYAEGRGGRSATCCFNVQCSIIECSEIGEIDGGVVDCTNGNAFGSVCTFQCDDGFILEGPPVSVCEESGISDPAVEWTNDKPTCQHVIQPILVEGTCPDDFVVDAEGPTAVVEWTNPTYQDRTTNEEVPVRCSHESGQTYGITVYPIVCEPDIATNFEYEICEFTVTVQHAACPQLRPPLHGGLALHKSSFAEIAFQQCQEGWDVPRVALAMSYTGEFHCSFGKDWQPSTVYDCSNTVRPGRMRILNELQYYSGNCEDDQTKQAIATNFVQQINQQTTNPNLRDVWNNCVSCGVEDVTVECGIESRRRKRDSAPSSDEYVLDIKFYLAIGVPASNSHKQDLGELFGMEGLLLDLSDEIADQVTKGQIVPEVPGLQIRPHDVPVIYHEVNAVCESGFASNSAKLNCVACPGGTFNDETESDCIPCPVGQYQNKTKRTTCNKCDEGKSTMMEGSVNITECIDLCPVGTSSPTGFQPCSRCNGTSVQPQMGQQSCLPCGEGTMKSQTSEQCLFDGCTEGYCENGGTCHGPYLTCKCPSTATGARCETLIVNGRWSEWSNWSACSETCGWGQRSRSRTCSNPRPSGGGRNCEGPLVEEEACHACLPIPTVEQGFLECDDNDEHLFNCTHHCNENNLPSVATLSTYNCGTSSSCSWNHELRKNRNQILPSCVEPEIPDKVTLTYHSTYPELICTNANQRKVKSEMKKWANDICPGLCNDKTVNVEGCPKRGQRLSKITGVRKIVTMTVPYDAKGARGDINATVAAPVLWHFLISDTNGYGSLNIAGQVYNVDTDSIYTDITPICTDGTYNDIVELRCVPCQKGSYWENGECHFCSIGSYQPNKKAMSCLKCPSGTTVNIGATSLDECIQ